MVSCENRSEAVTQDCLLWSLGNILTHKNTLSQGCQNGLAQALMDQNPATSEGRPVEAGRMEILPKEDKQQPEKAGNRVQ